MKPATLFSVIRAHAAKSPDAIALQAPSRRPMSYGRLEAHLQLAAAGLSQFGILPADPVAVMLPSGPELATTCLAVSSIAICAPLNPTSTPEEVRSFLERLRV